MARIQKKHIKELGQKIRQVVDEILRNFNERLGRYDLSEKELEATIQSAKGAAWIDLLENGPGTLRETEAWNALSDEDQKALLQIGETQAWNEVVESAQGQAQVWQEDRGR